MAWIQLITDSSTRPGIAVFLFQYLRHEGVNSLDAVEKLSFMKRVRHTREGGYSNSLEKNGFPFPRE